MRNVVWLGIALSLAKGVDAGWVSETVLGAVMGVMIGWAGHIAWLRNHPDQQEGLEG